MASQTCALCLGDDTDIPVGGVKDAEKLIMPCSTCSLVVHRMCLMEWFNSLPPSKITRSYGDDGHIIHGRGQNRSPTSTGGNSGNEDRDITTEGVGMYPPVAEDIDDQGMFNLNSRWGTLLVQWGTDSYAYTPSSDVIGLGEHASILLSADCPQCKNQIVFNMAQSSLLALNSLLRASIKDMVSYSGVFMGISGAAIGIVTVGYAGLTRCGVNMLEVMVPESILVSLLRKRVPNLSGTASAPPLPLPDRMEWDINVLSHFRFQLVPLLPLVLYRMRYSSIFGCIFNGSASSLVTDAFNEFLVCNYVSSLGNHVLAKNLYANIKSSVVKTVRTGSLGALGWAGLTKNINWWDPNVMIGSVIPARWLYDLLFRLTINKRHFDLSMSVLPKSIANSLSADELARYEAIESRLGRLQFELQSKVRKAKRRTGFTASTSPVISAIKENILKTSLIFQNDFLWRWIKLKGQSWLIKSLACLKNDYSSSLLVHSRVVTGVTTFLWPFVAADVGRIVLVFLSRSALLQNVSKPKLVLLANLIGMFGVAFLKDLFNLYLSSHKAARLLNMTIVSSRGPANEDSRSASTQRATTVPGAFSE